MLQCLQAHHRVTGHVIFISYRVNSDARAADSPAAGSAAYFEKVFGVPVFLDKKCLDRERTESFMNALAQHTVRLVVVLLSSGAKDLKKITLLGVSKMNLITCCVNCSRSHSTIAA